MSYHNHKTTYLPYGAKFLLNEYEEKFDRFLKEQYLCKFSMQIAKWKILFVNFIIIFPYQNFTPYGNLP